LSLTQPSMSRSLSTMPRQARIEYEGAIYHVMNRGDRREDIVDGDADRELFVLTLGEACAKCGWEVHAWRLMRNHFHLAVETPLGNLVAGMKWFLGAYTIRYNATPTPRSSVCRALQIADRGRSGSALPASGMRLYSPQSVAGGSAQEGSVVGGVPVEQLSWLFGEARQATEMAAHRSPFGRTRNPQ